MKEAKKIGEAASPREGARNTRKNDTCLMHRELPQRSWREDSRRCCKVYYFDYHYFSK